MGVRTSVGMSAADYLVNKVREGLAADDQTQLDRAVSDALHALGTRLPVAEAEGIAGDLYKEKKWAPLVRFTDALSALPATSHTISRYLLQGLVETGARRAAERLATEMLADESLSVHDRSELYGLVGRVNKDSWLLESGGATALQSALDAYRAGYDLGHDPLWHGVNILALQFTSGGEFADDLHPDLLLELARQEPRDGWSYATEIELLAGFSIGDPVPSVDTLLARYDCSPKILSALHRQLTEIWKIPADDPIILRLVAEEFEAPSEVDIVIPASAASGAPSEGELEKCFGTERPVGIQIYMVGAERARSVAKITLDGHGLGTAFVVNGTDLHPSLPDGPVLVTNEHVIDMPERPNAVQADDVDIEFELGTDGQPVRVVGARPVWWSAREDLDICVLVSDDPQLQQFPSVPVAGRTPRPRKGAYVYVIGHPHGGGLSVSIRGNDLTGGDKVRLHYTAPTEKGSSGSPVFDAEWELVAVHHLGKIDMDRADGQGTYEANEGMTIEAIRAQMVERPPDMASGA